ncbi:MAG TPA: acyl-CoA dehydrogenase family protein, partial [Candidatus Obscuribacterales bacterium]
LFKRIATAIAKYWICKRAPSHTYECLECLGGNGYVEESILPRIYRESPVNSVWEGSGNVICLDVLRAMKHEPETVDALFAEISEAKGANPRFDVYVDRLKAQCGDSATAQEQARRLVEQMALALEGSLILRYAPSVVADAFCASRLDGDWGRTFGTLSAGADCRSIIERASVPELDAR